MAQRTATQRTAFVTGGTGFLGINIVIQLCQGGWAVTALHRANSDLTHLRRLPVALVEGSITEIDSLRRAMPEAVDAVFHVAGNLNLWSRRNAAQTRDNVEGTRNMVAVALEKGARKFVHTSSISAYGLTPGRLDERSPQRGGESWINYQRSKFLAEEEVRAGVGRGLDAVILNPGAIVGAYDVGGWARIIRLVAAGRLPGVPPGGTSFCDVREVAKAHIAAAERGRTGENYLLGGVDAPYMALAQAAGAVAGRAVPKRATPAWLLRLMGRLGALQGRLTGRPPTVTPEAAAMVSRRQSFDCTKAQRELGFRPVPLEEMVEQSYRWLEREGLLASRG